MAVNTILADLFSENVKMLRRSEIREILKLTRKPGVISLAGGLPYPGLFPVEEMKEIVHTVLEREGTQALQYGPTEGDERLIDFLVNRMNKQENAGVKKENFLIVSGSQQALDLIGKLFINPGDPIIVGLPSYLGAIQAFRGYNPDFIGIPVDKQGMQVDKVEEALMQYKANGKRIKFIYTVPDFQNPSGVTMNLDRRKKLLALAKEYKTIIIEDSPYREIRFEGETIPMIGAMDDEGYALSLHTFSKIFAPGTRLGWIVANETIIDKLVMAKQPVDLCSTPFSQAIVNEFCQRGLLAPHIQKTVEYYGKKQKIMLKAMEEHFPKDAGIDWTHPEGGMFSWVTLPDHIDTEELFPKAVEKKVAYVIGAAFHFDRSGKNTLRLNFSYPTEEQLEEGIKRLGDLFKEAL